MPIETSIYQAFGVKPKSVADYDNEFAAQEDKQAARESNRLALMIQKGQYSDQLAQRERGNRLMTLAQGVSDPQELIRRLRMGGFHAEATAAEKSQADLAKDRNAAEKERLLGAKEQISMVLQAVSAAKDPQSYAQALQFLNANGIKTDGAPAQFDPKAVADFGQMALTAAQRLEQVWKQKGFDLDVRKQTEVERNNTTQNRISQGNLKVAQDRLANDKETSQATSNGLKAPAGYRFKPDGTLEAIPGGPAHGGGNATEGERKAATLLQRLRGSQAQLTAALSDDPQAAKPGMAAEAARAVGGDVPANVITGETRQRVEAAQLDMLDAALTLGTGAAYTKEQLRGYAKSYFPQIGDDPKTVKDKKARLQNVISAAEIAAGRAAPPAMAPANTGGATGDFGDGWTIKEVK